MKSYAYLLTISILVLVLNPASAITPSIRVSDDDPIFTQYPDLSKLFYSTVGVKLNYPKEDSKCTGVRMSNSIIMTAAHCFGESDLIVHPRPEPSLEITVFYPYGASYTSKYKPKNYQLIAYNWKNDYAIISVPGSLDKLDQKTLIPHMW